MRARTTGVAQALGSAALFGATTPLAARLTGSTSPGVLAGLMYLGSGLVLAGSMLWPRRGYQASLSRRDLPTVGAAIAIGGALAPWLLLTGLHRTPPATASLLLNIEVVFTALLAWVVFHEGFGLRIGLGLGCIVAAGVLLVWQSHSMHLHWAALAIVGACACWAVDNNITQRVADKDPRQIAMLKGLLAGGANLGLGLGTGGHLPGSVRTLAAMAIGVAGYGVSLMLFITAMRRLGTARSSALFALGPFVGVLVSVVVLRDHAPAMLWPGGGLMAVGAGLYLTERHGHLHAHDPITHVHLHRHDDGHHDHPHDGLEAGPDGRGGHVHVHQHQAITHVGSHQPDTHHRHRHHRN